MGDVELFFCAGRIRKPCGEWTNHKVYVATVSEERAHFLYDTKFGTNAKLLKVRLTGIKRPPEALGKFFNEDEIDEL